MLLRKIFSVAFKNSLLIIDMKMIGGVVVGEACPLSR